MKLLKKTKILAFLLLTFGVMTVSIKTEAASLHVQSEKIPEETTILAYQHWEEYLNNMIYTEDGDISNYYLGQPFTISYPHSIKYNYPIINKVDSSISYMLQIDSSDGQNSNGFILSKMLATKLDELSNLISTDANQSVTLKGINQNIYYTYQGESIPLLVVNTTDVPTITTDKLETNVSDLTEKSLAPNLRKARAAIEFDSNVLPWTVYEIQTDKPWCQFYTFAAVVNNQANKELTTAKKIIDGTWPTATEAQKEDTDWITKKNLYDAIDYVNRTFNKSIKLDNNVLPFNKIKTEIDNNRPIVANLSSDTALGHSIVLMGYTATKTANSVNAPFYHYWNPWWEDTFVVSSSSEYMTLGQDKYSWDMTVYNFQPNNYQDKIGKIVTLKSTATQYQTGETIPTAVRNREYTIKDVKEVKQSNSKLAYYLEELNKWVLEQDVQEYATPLLNKNVLLLSKATHAQTGEFLDPSIRNKRYMATKVKPIRQASSKLAYYLSGLNKWILEQDISQ